MRGAGWVLLVLGAATAVGCDSAVLSPSSGELQAGVVPDFGHVMLGRNASYRVRLQNIGRGLLTISDIHMDAPGLPDFVVQAGTPRVLDATGTMEVEVTFAPTAIGVRMARLNVANNGLGNPVQLTLSGTGILGEAGFGPNALNFGDVGVGSSYTLPITFNNTAVDGAAVNVSPLLGPDAASFRAAPEGSLAIPPMSTLPVNVTFRPDRTGPFTASIQITPCPTCAVQTVPITGTGIAADLTALPSPLNFGVLSPLQTLTMSVTVTNHGTRPAVISPPFLATASSTEFTVAPVARTVLTQNQTLLIPVTFAPMKTGVVSGNLHIPTDDDGSPMIMVPITGSGGGPAIEVDPDPLGFPQTAVGLTVTKSISVRNIGLDPQNLNPLVVSSLTVSPGPFTIQSVLPGSIDVGHEQYVFVTYTPVAAGTDTGALTILSNDPLHPTLVVPLSGSALKLPNCQYSVIPPVLDFGAVATGANVQLTFGIQNTGPDTCAIADLELSPTSPAVFAVTPLSTRLITPGDTLFIPVEFAPTSVNTWTGAVDFNTNSVTQPQGVVPLNAEGVPACFRVVPQTLNFGTVGLTCGAPTMSVQLENGCAVPVNVQRSYIGAGPSQAFTVNPAQAGAETLNPSDQVLVSVSYLPTAAGTDNNALYVQTNFAAAPFLVPLVGVAAPLVSDTDTYTLPPIQKVDVLWVVDNSGSMSNKQANLSANAGDFIKLAVSSGIDFHVAVTTTGIQPFNGGLFACPGGANGGEAGRFFPVDNSVPRILTDMTPNVENVFAENALVGICHYIEQGMLGMQLALSPPLITDASDPGSGLVDDGNLGFLRPDARLYIVWVTDEDDMMPDPSSPQGKVPNSVPVQTYVNFIYSLKPGRPDMVKASAIIGLPGSCGGDIDGVGLRYIQLVGQLGGQIADICSPDWGAVINDIAADAFQAQLDFPLQNAAQGRTVVVTVNGVVVPATSANGTQNWYFDPAIGNYGAVVFDASDAPGPNSTVTITYPTPCPP